LRVHAYVGTHSGIDVDVLITDVRMPGERDGGGLVRLVRERYPAMRVVIASAQFLTADTRAAADAHFSKPWAPGQLIDCVRKLTGSGPGASPGSTV
jgi:CheY-like chemotaxis protein